MILIKMNLRCVLKEKTRIHLRKYVDSTANIFWKDCGSPNNPYKENII